MGRAFYIRVSFPVVAESAKEASRIARYIPRVKHDHKDAILNCVKISLEEYEELKEINRNDEYLPCKNKQEQNKISDFDSRLVKETKRGRNCYVSKKDNFEYKRRKDNLMKLEFLQDVSDYLADEFYYLNS